MIEDRLLIWKFRRGSKEALARIYEKYAAFLLTLATALLNDANTAEDVVHDCFVSFVQLGTKLKLEGSLKAYLATSVLNRVRDNIRSVKRKPLASGNTDVVASSEKGPELAAVCSEESRQLSKAIAELPYDQREIIILRLQSGINFVKIAKSQNLSVNTIRSRYRYGLDKLRSILNSEVKK